jgi:hypothetical protein
VTLTVRVVEAVAPPPSVTLRVNVEFVAEQSAATFAVTLPVASTAMLLTVTPLPVRGVAVTVSLPVTKIESPTVAICEFVAAEPCCLETGAAVMVAVPLRKQAVTSLSVGVVEGSDVLRKALYFR